jgi:hypothetical protein
MKKNLCSVMGLIATVLGAVLMLARQHADPTREYLQDSARQDQELYQKYLQPMLNDQRRQEAEILHWMQQQQQQDAALVRSLFGR